MAVMPHVALVAGTALSADPYSANLTYVAAMAGPIRQLIDGKTPDWPRAAEQPITVKAWPEMLFKAYQAAKPAFPWAAKGLLIKANVVPAALRRGMEYWGQRPFTSAQLMPSGKQQLSAGMASWIADQESLLWDTEGGNATVSALLYALRGKPVPRPNPYWLTEALRALVSGESYIIQRNHDKIAEAIVDVRTWMPEAEWFGWVPSSGDRTAAASLLAKLEAGLNRSQALATPAYDLKAMQEVEQALTATKGTGDYYPPPHDPRPWWHYALGLGATGALGYYVWTRKR